MGWPTKEIGNAYKSKWYHRNKDRARKSRRESAQRMNKENPIKFNLRSIKYRAKKQGVAFNLNLEWYLAHLNVCEVTGIELDLMPNSPWRAEVDRINPGGDYTMDNCRLVCAIYNRARMGYSDNDVEIMANHLLTN